MRYILDNGNDHKLRHAVAVAAVAAVTAGSSPGCSGTQPGAAGTRTSNLLISTDALGCGSALQSLPLFCILAPSDLIDVTENLQ